jgi:aminoacyl-tRNA hydrolase
MKIVVGLGNPGRKYAGTRHNVGFDVVDVLADRHGLQWESAPAEALMAKWRSAGTLVVKPLTFMNLSGHAVGDLLRYFKVEIADLLVIVDEAQLELGRLRTRRSGSAGGHNGLKSLIELLGTDEFPRIRTRRSPICTHRSSRSSSGLAAPMPSSTRPRTGVGGNSRTRSGITGKPLTSSRRSAARQAT